MTATVFERLLYRFVGGGRDKNNFCVPVLDTDFESYIKLFTGDKWAIPQTLERYRYLGLNIDSIRKFGTLEFRHMGGTDDRVKILKWINLIFKLKQFAKKNSFDDIKARIDRLNTDSQYLTFFNDVFGTCSTYLDSSNLKADMEKAVSVVKRLTMPNDFWQEISQSFSTESVWYQKLMEKPKSLNEVLLGSTPRTRPRATPRRVENAAGGLYGFAAPPAAQREALQDAIDRIRQRPPRRGEAVQTPEPAPPPAFDVDPQLQGGVQIRYNRALGAYEQVRVPEDDPFTRLNDEFLEEIDLDDDATGEHA